jgi:hypothetical protein
MRHRGSSGTTKKDFDMFNLPPATTDEEAYQARYSPKQTIAGKSKAYEKLLARESEVRKRKIQEDFDRRKIEKELTLSSDTDDAILI